MFAKRREENVIKHKDGRFQGPRIRTVFIITRAPRTGVTSFFGPPGVAIEAEVTGSITLLYVSLDLRFNN